MHLPPAQQKGASHTSVHRTVPITSRLAPKLTINGLAHIRLHIRGLFLGPPRGLASTDPINIRRIGAKEAVRFCSRLAMHVTMHMIELVMCCAVL